MDIPKTQAPMAPPSVKTEYSPTPGVEAPAAPKKEENFGAMLNRMSGVNDKKDLYKNEAKNAMSKDSYLKMMMEQLKYQDPFNPVKNEQFTQNMAMMSQLEQQMNMNKNLEKMLAQNNNMQIAALQLVGKSIQADSASLFHEEGKFTNISFKLPQDAKELSVEVVGAGGEALRTINLGTQNAGDISTKWDGLLENDQPVPSGKYSFRIKAVDMEDHQISIPSRIEGRVTGVTNVQGVTFLLVGDKRVALNEIEIIKEDDGKVMPAAGVADFVNASKVPTTVPTTAGQKTAASDEKPAGTKVATTIEVDPAAEKELEDNDSDMPLNRRSPLEKENLSDLMQVMFR